MFDRRLSCRPLRSLHFGGTRIGLAAVLFLAIGPVSGRAELGAAEGKLRALMIDGQNNHDWRTTTPLLVAILENTGRFAVDVATAPEGADLARFHPTFRRYDVVISNYNGASWSDETRADFERYVAGGGGFVAVHAANNSFPDWEAYNRMIGLGGWGGRNEKSGPYIRFREGKFVRDTSPGPGGSHGAQHEFVLDVRAPEHPIVRGLPKRWRHTSDELYDRLRGPAEDMTVLATAYSDPKTGGTGENEPLLFALQFGKGRVFHTALGHGPGAIACVGFQVTLARGAEWAATGEVTLRDVPRDFPSDTEASAREIVRRPRAPGPYVELFDGETLRGWTQKNGIATYRAENGAIVGRTAEGSPNSFLCTERLYDDFELLFEVKVDDELNSGVQIRSNSYPEYNDGRVHGYQVEIATNGTAGFIYDEARRGWLSTDEQRADTAAQAAFVKGEWNRYRVVCDGDSIRTWVNDVPVADVKDAMTAIGFIGLQVHGIGRGSGPFEVRWRNLYLRELQ